MSVFNDRAGMKTNMIHAEFILLSIFFLLILTETDIFFLGPYKWRTVGGEVEQGKGRG